MVNHPNRKAATADDLRGNVVAVTKRIKHGEFSNIDEYNGERIVLIADWQSKHMYVSIVKGSTGTLRVQRGWDETFEVTNIFPRYGRIEEYLGETGSTTAQFNKAYQEHIIYVALKAEALLNKVPEDDEVSDEVKSQVREILEPYISEHERIYQTKH